MPTTSAGSSSADASLPRLRPGRGVDAGALGAFFERQLTRLRRAAHGRLPRGARAAAGTSDVVQDAIAATLARLDVFQPRSRRALAAYLRAAVRNRIADGRRRAARWSCGEPLESLASTDPTPLDRAIDAETRRAYRAALETLSRRDRQLVVAHLELDYTHAQLACLIGRSPHAARMALARAMARLAARLAGR